MECPYCGKPAKTERGLKKHLTGTRPYGGHELADADAATVASQTARGVAPSVRPVTPVVSVARPASRVAPAATGPAVRPGHYAAVRYMTSPAFREIVELFDAYPEIGGTYFRPLDKGVRAVDLHAESLKPRIGIGDASVSLIRFGATAAELAPTMAGRIEYLAEVRARQKAASCEVQLEARLIREAQANGLRLPGFSDDLRFIHSQWRIDSPESGHQEFTDLLAVDVTTGQLVIIELKADPDTSAIPQAQRYAAYLAQRAGELVPFFTEVARMMGSLYNCPELERVTLHADGAALAAWPNGSGLVVVDASLPTLVSAAPESVDRLGLGPQVPSDPPFRARMRRHQSWYRSEVLGLPYGTGPTEKSATYYGNMLTEADAEAGANFLTPQIFAVAQRRIAEGAGVERFRCLRNMLSSQPMCFNIFGPMVDNHDLATRLIGALLPGEVEEVTDVRMEYAPLAARLALGDRTSFDAYIAYRRPDGAKAMLCIETKLSEPFSTRLYDTPEYRAITEREPSVWRREAWSLLSDTRWNQLWRNHMLVEATKQECDFDYGRLVLVRHPEDAETAAIEDSYRSMLVDPAETFASWPLDRLVDAWGPVVPSDSETSWLRTLHLRYVALSSGRQ